MTYEEAIERTYADDFYSDFYWCKLEIWMNMRKLWKIWIYPQKVIKYVYRKVNVMRKILFPLSGWLARKGKKLRRGK